MKPIYTLNEPTNVNTPTLADNIDHKNLNKEVAIFANRNPTAENIAVVIWDKLRKFIDEKLELSVTLYETPRNFVTYAGA